MIPIKDNLNPQRPAYVTWFLLGLNLFIFFLMLGLNNRQLVSFYQLFGIIPARILYPDWASWAGFPSGAFFTLLSSMFVHGGWLHILSNSWMLWLFGDDVEDRIGHGKFLALYLFSGIFAGLTQIMLFPESTIPTIGASGAVAGVMGAFLFLFPSARLYLLIPIFFFFPVIAIPAALFLPVWFLGELFSGTFALLSPGFSNVAFWAHVGGFIAGIYLLKFLMNFHGENVHRARYRPGIIKGPGFILMERY